MPCLADTRAPSHSSDDVNKSAQRVRSRRVAPQECGFATLSFSTFPNIAGGPGMDSNWAALSGDAERVVLISESGAPGKSAVPL